MKIKNREKFLAISAICAVTIFAGDQMILSPMIKAWQTRAARIVDLRKSIAKGNLLLEREKTIKSKWDNMKKHALPTDKSVAQNAVLQSVDRWAKESAIGFNSITPTWKPGTEDFQTLECRADASGNIDSLSRFLYELERDPLALKIENIEVTARDTIGQLLALRVGFSGLLLAGEER